MSNDERVERVRAVFDDWAERGRGEGMEKAHAFAAGEAFEHLDLHTGARFLDIGCGNGYTVRWALERVGPTGLAVGLDVSERMLERARSLSPASCTFHHAAFPAHPFASERFDAIFSMEVLYYLPDPDAALRAVRDLLVGRGRFACVLDYYGENEASHEWPRELDCELTLRTAGEWRGAFERAGLEVLEQRGLRHPPIPGKPPSWKQELGSLLTIGTRRSA